MSIFSSAGKVINNLKAAGKAANLKKFSNMGSVISSHLPAMTGGAFKAVPRVFPNPKLTGAAAKTHQKLVNKSANNLFIGMRLNKPTQAVIAGGIIGATAIGTGSSMFNDKAYGQPFDNTVHETGLMPRLSGPPDMGATGDLTLALNRRR